MPDLQRPPGPATPAACAQTPAPPLARVGSVQLQADDSAQTRREKLARIVLDGMYQFVGLLDAQGMTLEINRAALEGAGTVLDDIRGQPFWEARWFQVSPETVQWQRELVRRAAAGEFVRCDMEIYGQASGDQTIIVDFSLLPITDDQGRVVFLLAEGRNITDKKHAEAEVARKTAELQALLERVRQLDQLKSDLFANVSHELRTPLALILGPVDELLTPGNTLSPPQRQHLEVVRRNASVLLKHVDDMLDLAKLDARKMELRCDRVNLASVVRVLAEQFHALAPQRSLVYGVSTPDVLQAVVDRDKVERIVLNLLSNAFKFTPAGGRIRCVLEQIGPSRCVLSVQDSGPGVPEAMREAIFERFRQNQQGTTRPHGGTGLGLAIVKEFVDLHAGTIRVTEAPDGGACFLVELPLAPADALPPPVDAAPTSLSPALPGVMAELALTDSAQAALDATVGSAAHPDDDRPVVLVVEDNAEMRRFIRDALSPEAQVQTVADGLTALARVQAAPPDLVVTDLMLPGLGGDRLVEAMRTHAALRDVPVIVLSARDDDALRARLLVEAVQDYVTKPFSAHELRARVRNLLTMKRARDVLRAELASQSNDLTQLTRHLVAQRRALQESEYRWWAVYEHSPVGIALIDAQGHVRVANPAFRAMLGYSAEEVRRCTLQRITPEEDWAATQQRIAQLIAGSVREYHVQRRYLHQTGRVVWANTSVALILGVSDAEPLLVVVTGDITAHKQAEEALTRARQELAQVTRVSTLGELAASIAHEVNQPLAAIMTNAHASVRWLAAQPPDEAEARAAIERIVRDASRAAEVITRIRAFLQRREVQRNPIALNDVVEDVLGLLRAEARGRRVALSFEPAAALPPVLADRIQVQQVILNLVLNGLDAIQRAAPGAHRLTLRTQRQGDALRLEVSDSGAGLELGIRARLFEAFQTTKPEGMGMGLAISRSIIEAHGGTIGVVETPPPGTTFCFTLPITPDATPDKDQP